MSEKPSSVASFPLLGVEQPLLTPSQLGMLATNQIAFIGDIVFKLHASTLLLNPQTRPSVYYDANAQHNCAEAQAKLLRRLLSSDWPLTSDEKGVLRRGRNCARNGPPRLIGLGTYREASALEALVGHLYLSDRARLQSLLDALVALLRRGEDCPGDTGPIDWKAAFWGPEDSE